MRFIASGLRSVDPRLLLTAVLFVVAGVVLVTTPTQVPARWGSVVLALAVFGFVHLLEVPLSWLQARFTVQAPTWSMRTWSVTRRWYGPGKPVRTTDGQIGTVIGWADEDTDVIWVLIRTHHIGADPATSHTTAAWRPLTDLSPHPFPQQVLTTR